MSASAGCGHSVARAYGYSRPFLSWGCCCWTAGREVSAIRGLSGVSCSVANRIQTRAISIRRRPESSLVTVGTSRKHSRASRRYSSARLSKKRRPLRYTRLLQAERCTAKIVPVSSLEHCCRSALEPPMIAIGRDRPTALRLVADIISISKELFQWSNGSCRLRALIATASTCSRALAIGIPVRWLNRRDSVSRYCSRARSRRTRSPPCSSTRTGVRRSRAAWKDRVTAMNGLTHHLPH